MRPPWVAIAGSTTSWRRTFSAASVPLSSRPIRVRGLLNVCFAFDGDRTADSPGGPVWGPGVDTRIFCIPQSGIASMSAIGRGNAFPIEIHVRRPELSPFRLQVLAMSYAVEPVVVRARSITKVGTSPSSVMNVIAHQALRKASRWSAAEPPGVPMIAIRPATPTAMPVWRIMFTTAEPVANDEGGSAPAAAPISVGMVRPTPIPVRMMPPNVAVRLGVSVTVIAHQAQPAAKTMRPSVTTGAVPKRLIDRPATSSAVTGTRNGPGAIARPACNGDHCQTPSSHNTSAEQRRLDQGIAGACAMHCEDHEQEYGDGEARQNAGRVPTPFVDLHQAKGESSDAGRDQRRTHRIGSRYIVARNMRQLAPTDDERGQADRHVDDEDPAPAQLEQQSAGDRTEGGGKTADRRPGAHSAGAALGWVGCEQQANGGRRHQRRARGLHQAEGSVQTPVAAAHAAEAAVKSAMPTRKLRSRRWRSASRPKNTRSAA